MPKKPNQPQNFVDLRRPAKKSKPGLIHDVLRPLPKSKFKWPLAVGVALLIVIIGVVIWRPWHKVATPQAVVSNAITKMATFPIYYPDNAKLPAGYRLDASSWQTGGGAVLFNVIIPGGKAIIVSEQPTPSSAQVATFEKQRLPLFNNVLTPIGTARVSALNGLSFTSLPTEKTWLLISAPYTINSNDLQQFLRSLKR